MALRYEDRHQEVYASNDSGSFEITVKTGPAARLCEPPELLGIGEEPEELLDSSDVFIVETAVERSLIWFLKLAENSASEVLRMIKNGQIASGTFRNW